MSSAYDLIERAFLDIEAYLERIEISDPEIQKRSPQLRKVAKQILEQSIVIFQQATSMIEQGRFSEFFGIFGTMMCLVQQLS